MVYELRGLIYAEYTTEAEFAQKIGWSKQRLNRITNGHKEPTLKEINEIADGLGKPVEDLVDIFLNRKSPNGQHIDSEAI